jgi:hypothetical protein
METVNQQAIKKVREFTFLAIVFVMWCIVYIYSSEFNVLNSVHKHYG